MSGTPPATDAKARSLGGQKPITARMKDAITSRRLRSSLGIKKLSLPTLKLNPGALEKALKARRARGLRYDDEVVIAKTRIKINDEKFDPRRFVDVRPFTKTFFPELDLVADGDELNDYRKIFSKVFNSVAPGEVPLSPCDTEERDIIYEGLYTWRDSLKGEVEGLRKQGRESSFDMENRMRVLGDLVYLISAMERNDAEGKCTNYTDEGVTTGTEALDLGERGQLQELLRMFAFLVLQAKFKIPEYDRFTEEAQGLVEGLKKEPVTEGEMNGFLTLLREQEGATIPGIISEVLDATETQPGLLMVMVEDVLRSIYNEIEATTLKELTGDLLAEFGRASAQIREKDTTMRARILELMTWFVMNLKERQAEVERLQALRVELSSKLTETTQKVEGQAKEIAAIKGEKETVQKALADMTTQHAAAASGAAEAEGKLEALRRTSAAQIRDLEEALQKLTTDNQGLNQKKIDLEAQLAECTKALTAARAENARLTELNKNLNEQLAQKDTQIEELRAATAAMLKELTETKEGLAAEKAKVLAETEKAKAIQVSLDAKTKEAAECAARVAALEKELEALKASAAAAAAGAVAAGAAAAAQIAKLEGELAAARSSLAAAEKAKEELEGRLTAAEAAAATAEKASAEKVAGLEARIAELTAKLDAKNAEMAAKIKELGEEKAGLAAEVEKFKAAVGVAQKAEQDAKEALAIEKAKVERADADLAALRAEIERQVAEIAALKGQLAALETKSRESDAANTIAIAALRKQLADKEAARAATATELAKCQEAAKAAADGMRAAAETAEKEKGELKDAVLRAEAAQRAAEDNTEATKAAADAAASGAQGREKALKDEVAGLQAQLAEIAGAGAGSAQKLQDMERRHQQMLAEIKRIAAEVSEGKNPAPQNFQNAGINSAFMDLLVAMRRVAATSANQLCYLSYFITFFYKVLFFNKREFNRRYKVLEAMKEAAQKVFDAAWSKKTFSRAGDTANDQRITAFKCLAALFELLYSAESMFLTDQHFTGEAVGPDGEGIYALKRDKAGAPDPKRPAFLRTVKEVVGAVTGEAVRAGTELPAETAWILRSMFENLNINLPDIHFVPPPESTLGADAALGKYNMFTYIKKRQGQRVDAEPRYKEKIVLIDLQGGYKRASTPLTGTSANMAASILTDTDLSYHTLFCLFLALGELYLRKSEPQLKQNQCELPALLSNNAAFLTAMGEKEKADKADLATLEAKRQAEIAERERDKRAAGDAIRRAGEAEAEAAGAKGEAATAAAELRRLAAEKEAALGDLEKRLADAERRAAAEAEKAAKLAETAEAEARAREAAARKEAEEAAERARRAASEAERIKAEEEAAAAAAAGERARLEAEEADRKQKQKEAEAEAARKRAEKEAREAAEREAAAAAGEKAKGLQIALDNALRALDIKVGMVNPLLAEGELDPDDYPELERLIGVLAGLNPPEGTKYTEGLAKGQGLLRSIQAAWNRKLTGLGVTISASEGCGEQATLQSRIQAIQRDAAKLQALAPPPNSEYSSALERAAAVVRDLQNCRFAAAVPAPAPKPAAAPVEPAGPQPYKREPGQSAGLMISGSNPKQFISPDIMVPVKSYGDGNRISLQNKYSMVRSHFGLLVDELGIYDDTDLITKINEQYQVMKRKAGGRALQTPSYVVNLGGKLTFNKGSFETRGRTWTMAGGGGTRRARGGRANSRASRKRRHN